MPVVVATVVTAKPAWSNLWAFPVALAAAFLLVGVAFAGARAKRPKFGAPLQYLDSAWSFDDSWVSNVTVIGGLLTGVLGSNDVLTAALGTDAKSSAALATVGAAVAAAFVGAGPILLLATKTKNGDFFSVGGLLAASAVTIAGAGGELWVVYRSGAKLDLGGWEDFIWIPALAATALLVVYAYRTLGATLGEGLDRPPAPPPSDTIVAARMIVAALGTLPTADTARFDAALAAVAEQHPRMDAGESDDYPRRRRSALM